MQTAIKVESNALEAMKALAAEAAAAGLETGGYLFGEINCNVRTILHATGPGKNAKQSAVQFEADYVSVAQEFERVREKLKAKGFSNLKIVGAWHLHDVDGLSGGDQQTLRAVCNSAPGFLGAVLCGFEEKKLRVFTLENEEITELPWVVDRQERKIDFQRTKQLVSPEILATKNVLVVGLGSGGSTVACYLARSGVSNFVLADYETLESHNLVRHVGKVHEVGKLKTEVVRGEIKGINPNAVVQLLNKQLDIKAAEKFQDVIKNVDLVVAGTGSAKANRILNEICLRQRKPVVYAGVFAKAAGGFVLQSLPREDSPCLNCVFEATRYAVSDSNEQLEHMARDYGMSEDELHAQQGLYVDISFVALLHTKMALSTLLRGHGHGLPELPGNVVVWNANTLNAKWVRIGKRKDCVVCNPGAWMASHKADSGEAHDAKN